MDYRYDCSSLAVLSVVALLTCVVGLRHSVVVGDLGDVTANVRLGNSSIGISNNTNHSSAKKTTHANHSSAKKTTHALEYKMVESQATAQALNDREWREQARFETAVEDVSLIFKSSFLDIAWSPTETSLLLIVAATFLVGCVCCAVQHTEDEKPEVFSSSDESDKDQRSKKPKKRERLLKFVGLKKEQSSKHGMASSSSKAYQTKAKKSEYEDDEFNYEQTTSVKRDVYSSDDK
mmetsp:Transcript_81754/g.128722  ORF Transcript_81754/g.128722 Transcript_81754/m.128722 type:complete len:235 (+) Transcript_81754:68-772(+)